MLSQDNLSQVWNVDVQQKCSLSLSLEPEGKDWMRGEVVRR